MACCQHLFALFIGLGYLCGGYCAMLKDHFTDLKRPAVSRHFGDTGDKDHSVKDDQDLLLQDTVSEHMQMLYEKYNRAGFQFMDGNTVRSFKAHWGTINGKQLQIFNLTSLTRSEDVLSATLHYYIGDLQNGAHRCTNAKTCRRHGPRKQSPVHLGVWSFASVDNGTRTLGHFVINASALHGDVVSWQWRDITQLVNQAKHQEQLLIGIGLSSWRGLRPGKLLHPDRSPYVLVFANDSAISEPESVVSSLQRHQGALVPGLHRLGAAPRRSKRSPNVLLPLQNNELPGPEYPYEPPGWDEPGPYDPLEPKPAKRPRKKPRKSQRHKMPLLQFDEQTIKKARKKQWNEPRNCARRYLKVDFADIGWSDWIISPKSFDAYYCSGSCPFPMPKSLNPSNHATIQSIVRAVGVVSGIPEPCCVPERMSSLSVLFFDEHANVVLKVYPNMTVDSCACR
ncbi:bone morphogenetic protein 3 [Conger conger]|uniref:bone morphogenetic protein 3 n=1 Tax=Conger conger TaxID=82655 RepID=UPI002A59C585|nr:bone morphogenetic protein 3 [Conger conger]